MRWYFCTETGHYTLENASVFQCWQSSMYECRHQPNSNHHFGHSQGTRREGVDWSRSMQCSRRRVPLSRRRIPNTHRVLHLSTTFTSALSPPHLIISLNNTTRARYLQRTTSWDQAAAFLFLSRATWRPGSHSTKRPPASSCWITSSNTQLDALRLASRGSTINHRGHQGRSC